MELILIDDNSTVLRFIELMLNKEQLIAESDKLNTFISIKSFMNNYKKNEISIQEYLKNIDLIICDYDLGKESINGLEFLNNLINLNYKGECVLLTGDDTYELRNQLKLCPTVHYVIKNSSNDKNTSTVSQIRNIINLIREKINVFK